MVRAYSDVLCRRKRDRVTASCCCGDDRRVGALIQPVSEPIHSGPLAISTVLRHRRRAALRSSGTVPPLRRH